MAPHMKYFSNTCETHSLYWIFSKRASERMIQILCFEHLFLRILTEKHEILLFIVKNRVNKEDFSKISTGEIPVSTGPAPALIRCTHSPWNIDFSINNSQPAEIGIYFNSIMDPSRFILTLLYIYPYSNPQPRYFQTLNAWCCELCFFFV